MAVRSIPESTAVRRPGRPRDQQARKAILAAAGALLHKQGLRTLSMDAVAERAGVSKATIYRWWPSKGSLALEVFADEVTKSQQPLPDRGSLRRDLQAHVGAVVRSYGKTPTGKLLADLIGEFRADRALAANFRNQVIAPVRAQNRQIFARAIGRNEIPAGVDTDIAMDMLYGAIWERLLVQHGPLNERFAGTLVDLALKGLESKRPTSG